MRLRMKLWPQGGMPAISQPLGKLSALAGRFASWQSLGAALLGIMLAKWAWVLLAPASPAMPAAAWEASGDAGRLFGTARVVEAPIAAPMGNIKLIGVFAHRTQGFAVMQVDDKQIGVAQGEEVKPGIKLAETHADYVMLEQAGVRQRVDISGASAPGGIVTAPPPGASAGSPAPDNAAPAQISSAPNIAGGALPGGAAPAAPPGQIEALQRRLDAADGVPPQQREMLKRKLDNIRGQH